MLVSKMQKRYFVLEDGRLTDNKGRVIDFANTMLILTSNVGSRKILQMAGIQDCYTASQGHTKTKGNFAKAAFNALAQAYSFLTPDLWRETKFLKPPNQEHTDFLAKMHTARKSTSSLLKPQGA